MAVFVICDNPCGTDQALFNVCQYIVAFDRTHNYVGGRGLIPSLAYEQITYAQRLWEKNFGRRAYHCVVGLSNVDYISCDGALQIAYKISSLFFPEFQVLYGVHVTQKELHIHFAISTVSLIDGHKLNIGFAKLQELRQKVNEIEQDWLKNQCM